MMDHLIKKSVNHETVPFRKITKIVCVFGFVLFARRHATSRPPRSPARLGRQARTLAFCCCRCCLRQARAPSTTLALCLRAVCCAVTAPSMLALCSRHPPRPAVRNRAPSAAPSDHHALCHAPEMISNETLTSQEAFTQNSRQKLI